MDMLAGTWMFEAQDSRMKGLTRAYLEAVLDKLTVFRVDSPLVYRGAAVALISEKRMAYV